MSAQLAIARVTTRQLLSSKRYLWFGLLALAPTGLFLLVSPTVSDSELFDLFVGLGIVFYLSVVVPIIVLTFGASSLGQERRDNTLSFLVLRPISRWGIAAAKLLGAIAAGFLLTGAGALALGVVYGIQSGDYAWIGPLLGGTAVATVAYVAVFVPLGFITQRATLIGLAFVFIWENGVVFAATGLITTSPWRIGFATLAALAPDDLDSELLEATVGTLTPSLSSSLIRAGAFLVAGWLITTLLLRRRDLV